MAKIDSTSTSLVNSIAVDAAGAAYITGGSGPNAPDSVGAVFPYDGAGDVFVAKVSPSGGAYEYDAYLGGGGGNDIAVDAAGAAYVAGSVGTVSAASFPAVGGPDLTYNGGSAYVIVAKLNPAGTALEYAGFIGGSDTTAPPGIGAPGADLGNTIAIDADGNAFVAGETFSTEATFPVLGGPDLSFNGFSDIFLAKIGPTGTLLSSGYIGGSGPDYATDVAVDPAGAVYLTGFTNSYRDFPVTKLGPDRNYNGGTSDGFVAKVDPSGTTVIYAGFIGGRQDERGEGIAVNAAGDAYVTGLSNSSRLASPRTVSPGSYGGNTDAFVIKYTGE